jgi:hypothetical protein
MKTRTKKIKWEENRYLPNPQLGKSIAFWRDRGTFNVELYLLICKVKAQTTEL